MPLCNELEAESEAIDRELLNDWTTYTRGQVALNSTVLVGISALLVSTKGNGGSIRHTTLLGWAISLLLVSIILGSMYLGSTPAVGAKTKHYWAWLRHHRKLHARVMTFEQELLRGKFEVSGSIGDIYELRDKLPAECKALEDFWPTLLDSQSAVDRIRAASSIVNIAAYVLIAVLACRSL